MIPQESAITAPFSRKEPEPQRFSNLPKATQLVSDRQSVS